MDDFLCDLMAAFYSADSREVFLENASCILNMRLSLLEYVPREQTRLDDSSASPSGLFLIELEDVPHICMEVISNGVYVCSIATDAPYSINAAETIACVAALIKKGIVLHGWFPDAETPHPDYYLTFHPPSGGDIYCLYCAVPMSSRHSVRFRNELIRLSGALHCYSAQEGFALILQCAEARRQPYFTELSDVLSSFNLSAGISGPFASARLALSCTEKAREAALAQNCEEFGNLRFASVLRWSMFCARAKGSIQREGYCMKDFLQYSLLRILAYDTENGTQYYESMYRYLLFGKDLKAAAEHLGIHRNTLDYRIRRIEELFQIDFADRHMCFELLFSCKLYEETHVC